MKICAMVDRSAGNESVGEMWTETAVFDESATIADVLRWADILSYSDDFLPSGIFEPREIISTRSNVKLSVLQEPKP
jgi:hypothetical protein